jgi:hypothetical protein
VDVSRAVLVGHQVHLYARPSKEEEEASVEEEGDNERSFYIFSDNGRSRNKAEFELVCAQGGSGQPGPLSDCAVQRLCVAEGGGACYSVRTSEPLLKFPLSALLAPPPPHAEDIAQDGSLTTTFTPLKEKQLFQMPIVVTPPLALSEGNAQAICLLTFARGPQSQSRRHGRHQVPSRLRDRRQHWRWRIRWQS